MPGLLIAGWQWDEGNLAELRHMGLSRRIVLQVASEEPKFRVNTSGEPRAASHQMIGPDFGGSIWVVCIVKVENAAEPDIWRAVTGWRADRVEEQWYRRRE